MYQNQNHATEDYINITNLVVDQNVVFIEIKTIFEHPVDHDHFPDHDHVHVHHSVQNLLHDHHHDLVHAPIPFQPFHKIVIVLNTMVKVNVTVVVLLDTTPLNVGHHLKKYNDISNVVENFQNFVVQFEILKTVMHIKTTEKDINRKCIFYKKKLNCLTI